MKGMRALKFRCNIQMTMRNEMAGRNASNQAPDENMVANEEMWNASTQSSDENIVLFQKRLI